MQTVICVVGPTAVGKTRLSIALAKTLQGEIINGDAFQVYQGMDIGTAKIKSSEMEGIPHHLFSHVAVHETYDVARYQYEVRRAIGNVLERHHVPILVGGTGLYLRAALYDYQFADDSEGIQSHIDSHQTESDDFLFERLRAIDPQEAGKLHPHNRRRVARALALAEITGQPAYTRHQAAPLPHYHIIWVGLTMDRIVLHQRQNERVDHMLMEGLIEEVRTLFGPQFERTCTSTQAIGYKELFPYLKGELTLDEAIEQVKIHTHQFTKRQMTWFKHQVPVYWVSAEQPFEDIVHNALNYIHSQGGPHEPTVSTN